MWGKEKEKKWEKLVSVIKMFEFIYFVQPFQEIPLNCDKRAKKSQAEVEQMSEKSIVVFFILLFFVCHTSVFSTVKRYKHLQG